MLKTNSKQASENIKKYIVNHYDAPDAGYENAPDRTADFSAIARFILETFEEEKPYIRGNTQNAFFDWCQGLPSVLDTCYYYNRSAVEDLGNILEESAEERGRFTEAQAEERLTYLIYRELCKGVRK